MSEETQWYVMQGEEQLGPYSGTQLAEFAAAGNVIRESLVWAEGMESWLPAGQIEGLFPTPAPVAQAAPRGPSPANPYAPPAGGLTIHSRGAALDLHEPYPSPGVKNTGMGAFLFMFLGGIVLCGIGFLIGGVIGQSAERMSETDQISGGMIGGSLAALLLILGGCILNALSFIPVYIALYRAWKCLEPGGYARTTPGAAVGMLFIPFFNYYWIFQAFKGLASDWNTTVQSYPDLKAAPRLSEGVFLTFCIGCFIAPLAIIMVFPVLSQMCRGINYFAFRPQPGQSVFGATTGGGMQIGGGFTIR